MIVQAPVSFAIVVAADYDCTLPEAIDAIEALGIEIVGDVPDVTLPDPADLELLVEADDGGFIDLFRPVKLRNIIGAALRTGRTIVDIAERLRQLGLELPDLDVELRPLLARVPTK